MTRDEAKAAVEARIFNGDPFTFSTLFPLCDDVEGVKQGWRVADATIQRLRKGGLIGFERKGRQVVWSLTEAGRAEAAARMAG